MIRGITFVGIPVKDQDVALKFYTECMGFKIATDARDDFIFLLDEIVGLSRMPNVDPCIHFAGS